MGSNDPPTFVQQSPFPNGMDSMGNWPPFSGGNDQSESGFQFDYAPPFKRPKNSDDDFQNSAAFSSMNPRMARTNPQINPPGKIFFKTRLCAKFRMGQCRNGENCNFAHGEEDRRKPPPNWQELVSGRTDDRGSGNWEDDDKFIHRMKLCKKFYNGEECPYGERCNFLHKEPPKARDAPVTGRFRESPRESFVISIGTTATAPPVTEQPSNIEQLSGIRAGVEAGFEASKGNVKPVYWKTRMCTKWEITGHCPFGEKCHFAHGHSGTEMQPSGGPESLNSGSNVPKPVNPAPANEPAAARTETFTSASDQQGQQGKKCLMKWKVTKKLNRIYADWLDDMPLNLPNEVEG